MRKLLQEEIPCTLSHLELEPMVDASQSKMELLLNSLNVSKSIYERAERTLLEIKGINIDELIPCDIM